MLVRVYDASPSVNTYGYALPCMQAPLEWYELYDAAKLAAWSGLCYYSDSATVRAALQADGLTLIDEGRNSQTSW